MKLTDMLILGGLAYVILSKSSQATDSFAGSSSSYSGGSQEVKTTGDTATSDVMNQRNESFTDMLNRSVKDLGLPDGSLAEAVYSQTGHIVATDIYKGRVRINQDAQIANIRTREGENTPITLTDNPLEVRYTVVGGKTFTSSRTPTSDAEKIAARKSNAASIAAADPSYKNTEAYKKIMSS